MAAALRLWITEIEKVLSRLLADTPFADVIDVPGLATAISAAFIGIELFDGIDAAAAVNALDSLQRLAILIEVADELGPVATRILRRRLAKRNRSRHQ